MQRVGGRRGHLAGCHRTGALPLKLVMNHPAFGAPLLRAGTMRKVLRWATVRAR